MIVEEKGLCRDEVYGMWQRNFHDPAPYADFYFQEVYGKNQVLLNLSGKTMDSRDENHEQEDEGTIKGMLHLNPYLLHVQGKEVQAHYIVGVATDEEYRRQGVMKELLVETFSRLRNQGEPFTYLMPADEQYYLPFDFRFGMNQIEQEMECFGEVALKETGEYQYVDGLTDHLEEICFEENQKRDQQFAVHTAITPEYLRRMEKEARSDFARWITVKKQGKYVGRFVVGAENDYMVLSQICCMEKEERKMFLYHALSYCENAYHYGKYQLVLEESWQEDVLAAGNYAGLRLLPARKKGLIMFRLLHLERMGEYLKGKNAAECLFTVNDSWLEEQKGVYHWTMTKNGSQIRKIADSGEKLETGAVPDGGQITIGALTALIFEDRAHMDPEETAGLTTEGKALLEDLIPLRLSCIQEIV